MVIIIALLIAVGIFRNMFEYKISDAIAEKEALKTINLLKGTWLGSYFQDTIIAIKKNEINNHSHQQLVSLGKDADIYGSNVGYKDFYNAEDSIQLSFDGRVVKIYHHQTNQQSVYDSLLFDQMLWNSFYFYTKDSVTEWFKLIKLDKDSLILSDGESNDRMKHDCIYKFKRIK